METKEKKELLSEEELHDVAGGWGDSEKTPEYVTCFQQCFIREHSKQKCEQACKHLRGK